MGPKVQLFFGLISYFLFSLPWKAVMDRPETKKGLEFLPMETESFREFARKHARSEEIGPIATYLDKHSQEEIDSNELKIMGLMGCEVPCAAVCCLVTPSTDGESAAVKLDSIIVNGTLRRQGLGVALVAKSFLDLVSSHVPEIKNLYAHSVHPATVRMLRSLGFSDPLPTGAPISAINLEEKGDEFRSRCNERLTTVSNNLKMNCSYCRSNHRKTRQWCASSRP